MCWGPLRDPLSQIRRAPVGAYSVARRVVPLLFERRSDGSGGGGSGRMACMRQPEQLAGAGRGRGWRRGGGVGTRAVGSVAVCSLEGASVIQDGGAVVRAAVVASVVASVVHTGCCVLDGGCRGSTRHWARRAGVGRYGCGVCRWVSRRVIFCGGLTRLSQIILVVSDRCGDAGTHRKEDHGPRDHVPIYKAESGGWARRP